MDSHSRRRQRRQQQNASLNAQASLGAIALSTNESIRSKLKRRKLTASNRFTPRWYSPGTGPPKEEKVFISSGELRTLVSDQLAAMLDQRYAIFLADADYYCTPLENAMDIINRSQVNQHTWVAEVFDCDDFAHILKGIFTEAAYKDGRRRKPHCFGIVWGDVGGNCHAFNWMVNSDKKLRFVEPQDHKVFLPAPFVADIRFMLG